MAADSSMRRQSWCSTGERGGRSRRASSPSKVARSMPRHRSSGSPELSGAITGSRSVRSTAPRRGPNRGSGCRLARSGTASPGLTPPLGVRGAASSGHCLNGLQPSCAAAGKASTPSSSPTRGGSRVIGRAALMGWAIGGSQR